MTDIEAMRLKLIHAPSAEQRRLWEDCLDATQEAVYGWRLREAADYLNLMDELRYLGLGQRASIERLRSLIRIKRQIRALVICGAVLIIAAVLLLHQAEVMHVQLSNR